MYKLVLAEPSVGASIAAVLNAKERKDGFLIGNGCIAQGILSSLHNCQVHL